MSDQQNSGGRQAERSGTCDRWYSEREVEILILNRWQSFAYRLGHRFSIFVYWFTERLNVAFQKGRQIGQGEGERQNPVVGDSLEYERGYAKGLKAGFQTGRISGAIECRDDYLAGIAEGRRLAAKEAEAARLAELRKLPDAESGLCEVVIRRKIRKWEFPVERFVTYETGDERWAKPLGFGREVEKAETKTVTAAVDEIFIDGWLQEFRLAPDPSTYIETKIEDLTDDQQRRAGAV